MQLPNKSNATISTNKILDYLLSETHAVGKSKAKFFRLYGFDETNVQDFERRLLKIPHTEEVSQVVETMFGIKYLIDGSLETPKGVIIHVRTIWIIETGDTTPKLVTVYPLG